MYAVSICPEFRKENNKTGILLKQKDCVFSLTDSLKINLVSIYPSYELNPMPCDPSTIDAAPWLRHIIKKTIQCNFISSYFFGNKYSLVAVTLSRFRMKIKMLRTKRQIY